MTARNRHFVLGDGKLENQAMTDLKDIVFETDHYWVKRVPKGFEVYKTGSTHSTRVSIIGYTGDRGLQRAKAEIERREAASGVAAKRHHATTKASALRYFVVPAPGTYGEVTSVLWSGKTLDAARGMAPRGYIVRLGTKKAGEKWYPQYEADHPEVWRR